MTLSLGKAVAMVLAAGALSACKLTVNNGDGGTVLSDDNKIECGSRCSAEYGYPATVTLAAQLQSGYRLDRWQGACDNPQPAPTCQVSISNFSGHKTVAPVYQMIPDHQYAYATSFVMDQPVNLAGPSRVDFGMSAQSDVVMDGALTAGSMTWNNVTIEFAPDGPDYANDIYRARAITLTIGGDGSVSAAVDQPTCSGSALNVCQTFVALDVWNALQLDASELTGQDAEGKAVYELALSSPVMSSSAGYFAFSMTLEVHGQGETNTDLDTDGDGIPDVLDPDDDNDGLNDPQDAFPLDPNEQSDFDSDGVGDNADTDDDNDGVDDSLDAFPRDPLEQFDFDADGIGDNADADDDNDNVDDALDAFPLDPAEWLDSDGDLIGNNQDPDDDNDGVADEVDAFPLDASESIDSDGDGVGNNADTDDDNDGIDDASDHFPNDPTEWLDTDGDGIGNNRDVDDDNDGVVDEQDAFPLDGEESLDSDGDGIGDRADPDDDNDGLLDVMEFVGCELSPDPACGPDGQIAHWVALSVTNSAVVDLPGQMLFRGSDATSIRVDGAMVEGEMVFSNLSIILGEGTSDESHFSAFLAEITLLADGSVEGAFLFPQCTDFGGMALCAQMLSSDFFSSAYVSSVETDADGATFVTLQTPLLGEGDAAASFTMTFRIVGDYTPSPVAWIDEVLSTNILGTDLPSEITVGDSVENSLYYDGASVVGSAAWENLHVTILPGTLGEAVWTMDRLVLTFMEDGSVVGDEFGEACPQESSLDTCMAVSGSNFWNHLQVQQITDNGDGTVSLYAESPPVGDGIAETVFKLTLRFENPY